MTLETASPRVINIGTRRSALARVQADGIQAQLQQVFPDRKYEIHTIATNLGDVDKTTPLYQMGNEGKSLWTHELEVLLAEGKLDMVVHCVKDMPTALPPKMILGSVTTREDPRDALCVSPKLSATHQSLASLPPGSAIGTSSVRRTAHLRRLYPQLKFIDCRGNVPTRLSKLDAEDSPYSALILAAAGLLRLGLGERITSYLSNKEGGLMYAVGQGALGIEIREDDKDTLAMIEKIACEKSFRGALAERSLMRTLEGGCSVPIGVESSWGKKEGTDEESDELTMLARVVSLDGKESVDGDLVKTITSRDDAEAFGKELAHKLVQGGADKILKVINANRPKNS